MSRRYRLKLSKKKKKILHTLKQTLRFFENQKRLNLMLENLRTKLKERGKNILILFIIKKKIRRKKRSHPKGQRQLENI